ncbi:MAG: alpha/beta fold hydrolase, partial [Sphingobacteriia bacterium]
MPAMKIVGTGPRPLLLLHPYLVPGVLYVPLVAGWAAAYTCYLPDFRGYASRADEPGPYTLAQYASDVALQMQQQGVEAYDVLGVSMGGLVAQLLARQQACQVQRLVLACTYAYKPRTLREKAQRMALPRAVRRLGGRGLARILYAELRKYGQPRLQDVLPLRQLLEQTRTEVLLENARELFHFDARPWLPQLRQPTLVIAAAQDRMVPLHHGRQLQRLIPQARLEVIGGAAHLCCYT